MREEIEVLKEEMQNITACKEKWKNKAKKYKKIVDLCKQEQQRFAKEYEKGNL